MDALLKALLPRCSGAHGSPRKSNACAVRAIRADHEGMTRSKKVFFFFETVSYAWRFLVKGQLPNVAAAAFAAQRGHYKVTAIRAHHKSLLQVFEVHFENFFQNVFETFFIVKMQ